MDGAHYRMSADILHPQKSQFFGGPDLTNALLSHAYQHSHFLQAHSIPHFTLVNIIPSYTTLNNPTPSYTTLHNPTPPYTTPAIQELIASRFTVENVAQELNRLLHDEPYRQTMLSNYQHLWHILGSQSAADTAADIITHL